MSLKKLIQQCKEQDRKAQSELYRLFASKLFAISLKYSRNKTEAEDNLQEAFLTIFDKIGQFNFKGSFEGWMRRITINTVLQQYRTQRVLNIVSEEQIEGEVSVAIDDHLPSIDQLLACIQQLPDRYRMVFSLYVLDGFSHKEVADMLGITEGTSKSNLARARMALKEKVEKLQGLQKKNVNIR